VGFCVNVSIEKQRFCSPWLSSSSSQAAAGSSRSKDSEASKELQNGHALMPLHAGVGLGLQCCQWLIDGLW
jgi:hypothetical protein